MKTLSKEIDRLNLSKRIGFFQLLKQLGVKQNSKHAYSIEKQTIVFNNGKSFDALTNDISLFTDEELFQIIKNYKNSVVRR